MNSKLVLVAMMGLGLSAVGCLEQSTIDELAALDQAEYMLLENPAGGGTTNHLRPEIFAEHKYELLNAMGYRLSTALPIGSHTINSAVINTGLLSTADGKELFEVAVECALADGQYVTHGSGPYSIVSTYTGEGMMSTTAGWYSGALTTAQKEDVLRCVVARVNASGTPVSIVISGQNVTEKRGESSHGLGRRCSLGRQNHVRAKPDHPCTHLDVVQCGVFYEQPSLLRPDHSHGLTRL